MKVEIQDVLVTRYEDPETGKEYYLDRFGNEYELLKASAVGVGAVDPNAVLELATGIVGLFKKKDGANVPTTAQPVGQQILPVIIPQSNSGSGKVLPWVIGGVGVLFAGLLIRKLMY